MNKDIQMLFYNNSTLLEGPEWNSERECISCVSILDGCVYVIYEKTAVVDTLDMNSQVGCALWVDRDHLLVATHDGIFRVDVDTGKKEFVTDILPRKDLRYNDGTFDRKQRLLVGTTGYNRLAKNENFLYSFYESTTNILVSGTTISNGIDFSPDSEYMYFVDTPTQKVGRYNYNLDTGEANFDKYIIYIEDGIPDGICTDTDGGLWVAHWGGYQVSKWDTESGDCLMRIPLPCKNVTSCCLGGKDKSYLYVTTAKHDDGTESEELAGGLFKIKIK